MLYIISSEIIHLTENLCCTFQPTIIHFHHALYPIPSSNPIIIIIIIIITHYSPLSISPNIILLSVLMS